MKLSFIIPAYNCEKYIKKCINSIIQQTTNLNYEIIIIDDGSTDNSGKICDNYSLIDKRIKVFHKSNGGLSSARNYGLDKMKKNGYVSFVDSDDFIHSNMIEHLLKIINEYSSDLVCCKHKDYSDFENQKEENNPSEFEIQILNKKEALKNMIVTAWAKLYKKEIFDNLRFQEGIIYEDAQIAPYVYTIVNKTVVIDLVYYYRYIRNDSIMHQSFSEKNFDCLAIAKDRIQFFHKKKYFELYESAYLFYLDCCITLYEKANYNRFKSKYNKYILKSFKSCYKKYFKELKLRNKIKYLSFYFCPKFVVKYLRKKLSNLEK